MSYFKMKEFFTLNDVLLKAYKILILKGLRKSILGKIYEGHLAMQRCKDLSRQSIYSPNIYNDIENIVICMRHQN